MKKPEKCPKYIWITLIVVAVSCFVYFNFIIFTDHGQKYGASEEDKTIDIGIGQEVHLPPAWRRLDRRTQAEECFKQAIEQWEDYVARLAKIGITVPEAFVTDYYLSLTIYYQNEEIITLLRKIMEEGK